jgi:hypothetical protein
MTTAYMLWSEWDIGESNTAFASKETGLRWLRDNKSVLEMADEENAEIDAFIQQLFEDGYFVWQEIKIIQ